MFGACQPFPAAVNQWAITPTSARVPRSPAAWDATARRTEAVARKAEETLHTGFLAAAAHVAAPEIVAAFVQRRPRISPSTVAAAWPAAQDADPVVQGFVACCVDVIAKN
jgi:hypothetical protein